MTTRRGFLATIAAALAALKLKPKAQATAPDGKSIVAKQFFPILNGQREIAVYLHDDGNSSVYLDGERIPDWGSFTDRNGNLFEKFGRSTSDEIFLMLFRWIEPSTNWKPLVCDVQYVDLYVRGLPRISDVFDYQW